MNIHFNANPPANNLSNFVYHKFIVDDVCCNSMGGFLQSLRFDNVESQANMCKTHGEKTSIKSHKGNDWKIFQRVWWKGKEILRGSQEYQDLLTRAFDGLSLNISFMKSLKATGEFKLYHNVGKDDSRITLLTVDEFIGQLTRIRDEKCLGKIHETSMDSKSLF
jgi:hypothetical protein